MTSKKRVRNAIEYKGIDRVPTHFSATPFVMENLKKHYGFSSNDQVFDHFNIDIRPVDAKYIGPELITTKLNNTDYETQGMFGEVHRFVWNGLEHNSVVVSHPLDATEDPNDVEKLVRWPNPSMFDYSVIKDQIKKYRNKALIFGHWGPFQTSTNLRSETKLYMDMAINPEMAHRIFDRMHKFQMEHYARIFEAGEGEIDILRTHDDYGSQLSTLFSMDMWREYFEKNTRELVDLAHSYGAYFWQHSCGAVRNIIPELIKCGVDVLEPIQPVTGMDPESLKEEFGRNICFVGGIDTQHLLPYGSTDDVKQEVKRYINALNDNGGYILYPSQSWESCIPLENINALYNYND